MVITKDFEEAVYAGKKLKIRIMLKDSLLVDRSFEQFNQMVHYAEDRGVELWDVDSGSFPMDRSNWSTEKLNEELVELVSNFSRSRVNYIKAMIKELYPGVTSGIYGTSTRGMVGDNKPRITGLVDEKLYRKTNIVKWNAFMEIYSMRKKIAEIQKNAKEKEEFSSSDVRVIQKCAEEIVKKCKEINGR